MYINENSLIINNVNMAPYIESVEFGYNKMWSDAGRNMKAKMTGTFLGIVVKLRLNFKPTTQAELEILAPILDSSSQTTSYYDPLLKTQNSISTYTGDWSTLNKNVFSNVARANGKFSISVIAIEPREE